MSEQLGGRPRPLPNGFLELLCGISIFSTAAGGCAGEWLPGAAGCVEVSLLGYWWVLQEARLKACSVKPCCRGCLTKLLKTKSATTQRMNSSQDDVSITISSRFCFIGLLPQSGGRQKAPAGTDRCKAVKLSYESSRSWASRDLVGARKTDTPKGCGTFRHETLD